NDRLPLHFIFDTGVHTSIITDKTLSDLIGVKYDRMYTMSGIGEHKQFNVYLANGVSVDFPGLLGRSLNMLVLEEDYLLLKNYLGASIHGILGTDLLLNLVLTIDYENHKLIFQTPQSFKPPRRAIGIPIMIHDNKPYILLPVTLLDGTKIDAKLLVDTGASHSLLLELFSEPKIKIENNFIKTILGRGLAGSIDGWIGRVKQMDVGNIAFKNVITFFTDTNSYNKNYVLAGRNGTIGGDLLGRFSVTIDYSRQMMYFERNVTYKLPFEFNMAGFDVIGSGDYFDKIEVVNVIDKSPAYEAGLRAGDIIRQINGISGKALSVNEFNNILRSRPGKVIHLRILRNNVKLSLKFKLKRLV
ncbi:MAG: aspartyl protease family protein, partial [Bacteroidota bacterium]|nr:aspartyl protease family protein [Bacteroidota bacterium]